MKKKYIYYLFCVLLFCSCLTTEVPISEPKYFLEKDTNDIKTLIVEKSFVEPNMEEKDGVNFIVSDNYEGDAYSINYDQKVYGYNLPINKREYLNDFINNPLEDIRGENLIYYFEKYLIDKNFKNIMNVARSNSWVTIKLPENRKIKIGDRWTEYTNGITKESGIKKKYLYSYSPDGYSLQTTVLDVTENESNGMFLGAVDNYTFKGIVEDNGIRYAILDSDMKMIITNYKFKQVESGAYINKGRAIIAYDYKNHKIKEIIYNGLYNAYGKGFITNPLDWADVKINLDEEIKQLDKDKKKVEKKRKTAEIFGDMGGSLWGGISGLSELSAEKSEKNVEKDAKKITQRILEMNSKLTQEQVISLIDNGLKSTNIFLRHDNPIIYKAYYLYNK